MARLNRTLCVALLGLVAALALVGWRWQTHERHWSAFVLPGARWVDARAVSQELRPVRADTGYDGQFVWRLARTPLTRERTADAVTLDNPPYRQQRILLPLLAHAVASAGASTALALVGLNVLAVAAACAGGALLARRVGRHAMWGLLLGLAPAMTLGLARSLTEPLALALLVLGLAAWQRERPWLAAGLWTCAGLARETSLVCVAAIGVVSLLRRDRRSALACLLPGAVALLWQGWVAHLWGRLPVRAGGGNLGTPVLGPLRDLLGRFDAGSARQALIFEGFRVAVAGMILWTVLLTVRRAGPVWARAGGLGGAVLALLLGSWTTDIAFLRATAEAWTGAQVLLLTSAPTRARTLTLVGSGLVAAYAALRFTGGALA